MKNTPRSQAMYAELNKCAKEYSEAKQKYEIVRVEFEAAKERLASVRHLAHEALGCGSTELFDWEFDHKEVQYVGMNIGDAICEALRWKATDGAWDHISEKKKYDPAISVAEIVNELDGGGFDFRSPTPLREVNAALMQLKGVTKLPGGKYQIADAARVLSECRTFDAKETEKEKKAEKEKAGK